jgi:hypothetical protein
MRVFKYTQDGEIKKIYLLNLSIEQFTRQAYHQAIPDYSTVLQLIRK